MENQVKVVSDESAEVKEKKPCPMRFSVLIIFIAVIFFLAIYSWGMYRLVAVNNKLLRTSARLNVQVTQNQKDIEVLQSSLNDTQQNLQRSQTDLTNQEETITELKNLQQTKNDEWTIAEAQYLVKLANDNLQIGDNIPVVINLLQTADQELQGSTNPQFAALRKALADDLASLKAVPAVDTTGIYVRLSALNAQVDKLPLPTNRPAEAKVETPATDTVWWKRGLQHTLEALQKIVIVRYSQPGVRPFILPEQQEYLYQNIHAMYGQAMSAVVHGQQDIYLASLKQASEWIQKYFLPDSPVTVEQLKALTELQSINIRPSLPTIAATLTAFHDYTNQTGKITTTS
jgi:uroporphyrin-III C-methyltransferase